MKKFGLQALLFLVVFIGISLFQIRNHIPRTTKAPLITGHTEDGTSVSKDIANQSTLPPRSTLIYFFAPWCGVCKVSMGNLNFLAKLAPTNIVIVALDYEKPAEVIDIIKDKELTGFDLILGDNATNQAYKVDAYPTYYVVSEKGDIVTSSVGYSSTLGMLLRMWYAAAIG